MPIIVPRIPFIRRRRRRALGATAPPVALALVAAEFFDADPISVTLTFDRAIDVAGLDGSQVIVNDGVLAGAVYAATGPVTMLSPASALIGLVFISEEFSPGITLTASATTGIVAVAPPLSAGRGRG